MTSNNCKNFEHSFNIKGVDLEVSSLRRDGDATPIVFLHGFGSSKEDYADIQQHSMFDEHAVLAYDAPGCGMTRCSNLKAIDIPFLVATAQHMLDVTGIERFHLVGHSMGGLTALMLASVNPQRVLSFTNIEGNIAPEDCFLSRQIHEYADKDPEAFMRDFIARARNAPAWSSPLYAANLAHKVQPDAVRGIFTSMVELSDTDALMDRFLDLPCPKLFMYGDQNSSLSYPRHIEENGVELAEVPQCGHFPMYSNPPEMWRRLAQFLHR